MHEKAHKNTKIMAKRFEEHQIKALKKAFESCDRLTKSKKIELVEATGLDVEQITSWFSRKRASKRAKESTFQLDLDHSRLEQELKLRHEREIILRRELEESKKRAAQLEDENRRLRERERVCERGVQFDEVCGWELMSVVANVGRIREEF